MSSEEALRSQSGILAMHVVGGQISNPKRRGRLEVRLALAHKVRHSQMMHRSLSTASTGQLVRFLCDGQLLPNSRRCTDATEAARLETPTWDEVGEAFVKELDFTHVLLKLNSADKDTVDEVYADARIDLRSFLETSMASHLRFSASTIIE